jgi:hypothetical protein
MRDSQHVLPPMPPPDIDVEAWRASLARLRKLAPGRLLLTHFGAFDDPRWHLDRLEARLVEWAEVARDVVRGGGDARALGNRLAELDDRDMDRAGVSPEQQRLYRLLCPMVENASGLAHYWKKKLKVES